MGSLFKEIHSPGIMRVLIVLAIVAFTSAWKQRELGTYERSDFAAYKAKYNKSFSAEEELMRHENYLKAVALINKHNAEYDQGKHTWFMGENAFLDWTEEEFNVRNGYRAGMIRTDGEFFVPSGAAHAGLSELSVLWRDSSSLHMETFPTAQSSSWLTVTPRALDVEVDLRAGLMITSSVRDLMVWTPRTATHTLPVMDHATPLSLMMIRTCV